MIAVWKHELRSAFHGMTAYLFCACFLVFVGIRAMLYNISSAVANFEYVLQFVCLGMVVIIPVLTMRSIAEERKQKTDQLLYALPLKTWQIVVGKYLAMVVVFLVPLAVVSAYPLVFAQYGEVYLPASYGAIGGFFAMNCALITIGMFLSSLTDNQGFAAGMGIAAFAFNYYSVSLAEQVSTTALGAVIALVVGVVLLALLVRALTRNDLLAVGTGIVLTAVLIGWYLIDGDSFSNLLPNLMKNLSLFERFYTFVNGVFDLTNLIFYGTVIAFFLFLTVQSMEKRRYN